MQDIIVAEIFGGHYPRGSSPNFRHIGPGSGTTTEKDSPDFLRDILGKNISIMPKKIPEGAKIIEVPCGLERFKSANE